MPPYRYVLRRRCGTGTARVCWVMLNPSTADARRDDPTIRRVTRFSHDLGYDELVVVNLFAARSTTPQGLATLAAAGHDVVGPGNGRALRAAMRGAGAVVVAWGTSVPARLRPAARIGIDAVHRHCRAGGVEPLCLGTTADGMPRHPLYVAAATPLRPWPVPGGVQRGSRGNPRTRSPRMLRMTLDVPPMIV